MMTEHEIATALVVLEEVMKCGDVDIFDIDEMLKKAFDRDGQCYERSVKTELQIEQAQVQTDWEFWQGMSAKEAQYGYGEGGLT